MSRINHWRPASREVFLRHPNGRIARLLETGETVAFIQCLLARGCTHATHADWQAQEAQRKAVRS